jgi:hypothetical protein
MNDFVVRLYDQVSEGKFCNVSSDPRVDSSDNKSDIGDTAGLCEMVCGARFDCELNTLCNGTVNASCRDKLCSGENQRVIESRVCLPSVVNGSC